jgi:precorrin-2/cobalt-factor-2 C20-methyltransferase
MDRAQNHHKGTLYGIGVGPGDPELLTVKAARRLGAVPVIFTPEAKPGAGSHALKVVEEIIDRHRQKVVFLHFPMQRDEAVLEAAWQEAAEEIHAVLESGRDAAFLTIGDTLLYSTFGYILDKMIEKHPEVICKIIPGVTSVTAVAAAAGIPLARTNERVLILPATYREEELRESLNQFETVVLVKVHRVLGRVVKLLEGMGRLGDAVLVSRCGTEKERIFRDLSTVDPEEVDYLSTLIVTRNR